MNRHPGLFSLAVLTTVLICTATVPAVRGQSAAPANIDAIKGSDNVATSAPQITAWIDAQVQALTSGVPAQATAAREQMIEAVSPGRVKPTPAFINAYAVQLNKGITPALQHESDLVRLNAAIVVARVAERSQSPALRDATLTLLNDKSRFVALWGMKAARWIVPAILRNPAAKADDLLNAMIKVATAEDAGMIGSPVVVEAYEALTLDALDLNAKTRPGPKEIATVIPFMQRLLQEREELYRTRVPIEPLAEQLGTLFLVNRDVWNRHTPAQKLASVQVMSDIIGLAAQQAEKASPENRDNLAMMIGRVAAAIAVVPETQPILDKLTPATKIDQRTSPGQIVEAVQAVAPALKTIKQFAALTPPPEATAAAPAPAPGATQPSTTSPTTSPTATAPASTAAATVGP